MRGMRESFRPGVVGENISRGALALLIGGSNAQNFLRREALARLIRVLGEGAGMLLPALFLGSGKTVC
jgi:hypothetical protein